MVPDPQTRPAEPLSIRVQARVNINNLWYFVCSLLNAQYLNEMFAGFFIVGIVSLPNTICSM